MKAPLEFGYTNHRGEYAVRRVEPAEVYYGVSDYYPGPQWLMCAWDLDRQAYRHFAMSRMRLDCPQCRGSNKANAVKHDPYSRH